MPITFVRNDITRMHVDAIVNAANETLLGGGGVDGAIHRAAGPGLLAECRTLGGCPTGEARITKGYDLPCKYVIHTVGPIWQGGSRGEAALLAACYRNSLILARDHGCQTVAFPLISAGVYGYPRDEALRIATDTIRQFMLDNDMLVYMVIFDRASMTISEKLYANIARYIDDNYVDAVYQSPSESLRARRLAQLQQLNSPRPDRTEAASEPVRAKKARRLTDLFRRKAGDRPAEAAPSHDADLFDGMTEDIGPGAQQETSTGPHNPAEEVPPFDPDLFDGTAEGIGPEAQAKPLFPSHRPAAPAPHPSDQADQAVYAEAPLCGGDIPNASLDELLNQVDESFSRMVLRKIDERGITDAACYKRANIDRKLFSKLRSDADYRPSKRTALALGIALELPLPELKEMLMKAGFALSRASRADIIVEYFVSRRQYDIDRINEALFAFDQPTLC